MITEEQLEQIVYDALKVAVGRIIGGTFYRSECRPIDSHAEDAELSVSSLSADQVQDGVVALNIYVQDINNGSGRFVPNKMRTAELSSHMSELLIALQKSMPEAEIKPYVACQTIANDNGREHFVNQLIRIKLLDNGK